MKIVISITLISLMFFLVLVKTKADIRRECRKQTGVSWGALKRLRAADFEQNDKKLKCYLKCFMKKNGIFGEKDIDIDKALRHLPRNIQGSSRKILENCKKIPSTDSCDKAFELVKCYFQAEPEGRMKIEPVNFLNLASNNKIKVKDDWRGME